MCEGGNQTIERSSGHIESPGYPETFTLEGNSTCLITLVVRGLKISDHLALIMVINVPTIIAMMIITMILEDTSMMTMMRAM